jgi:hypothetical protein
MLPFLVSVPQFRPPMLLKRIQALPEGKERHYEVKWNGYRMQVIRYAELYRVITDGREANFRKRTGHIVGSIVIEIPLRGIDKAPNVLVERRRTV